jgi:predicted  nucleic acid-binding Zn-ribbon protein
LSFSSGPRDSRSGGTSAKKTKKQKREFHANVRRRPLQEEQVDLAASKARALEGLAHLGQQKFSAEPGGYDLTHWQRGLNLLLDDFEAKMKDEQLPVEYYERRKEIESRFSAGVDVSQIESEMGTLRKEESELRATMDLEKERIIARLITLRTEKDGKAKEIVEQKTTLEEMRAKRQSASFLSKLSGRSRQPTEAVEQKIAGLEKGIASLEEEVVGLQSDRTSLERAGGTPSGRFEKQWKRLGAIGERLRELEAQLQSRSQLAKERETATALLAEIISRFELKDPESEESVQGTEAT